MPGSLALHPSDLLKTVVSSALRRVPEFPFGANPSLRGAHGHMGRIPRGGRGVCVMTSRKLYQNFLRVVPECEWNLAMFSENGGVGGSRTDEPDERKIRIALVEIHFGPQYIRAKAGGSAVRSTPKPVAESRDGCRGPLPLCPTLSRPEGAPRRLDRGRKGEGFPPPHPPCCVTTPPCRTIVHDLLPHSTTSAHPLAPQSKEPRKSPLSTPLSPPLPPPRRRILGTLVTLRLGGAPPKSLATSTSSTPSPRVWNRPCLTTALTNST